MRVPLRTPGVRRVAQLAAVACLVTCLAAPASAHPREDRPDAGRDGDRAAGHALGRDLGRDLGREVLAAGDGWAAAAGGTTGGATADPAHVLTVRSRAELVRALDGGSATPKIIKVVGTIDANTDDEGRRLSCADSGSTRPPRSPPS